MLVQKDKICKCGHLKDDHKDKPESKFSWSGDCKKCKCSDYMNRKFPNRSSKIILGCWIGFSVLLTSSFILMCSWIPSAIWNKPEIPVSVLMITLGGVFAIVILSILPTQIASYIEERKRKSYPIE